MKMVRKKDGEWGGALLSLPFYLSFTHCPLLLLFSPLPFCVLSPVPPTPLAFSPFISFGFVFEKQSHCSPKFTMLSGGIFPFFIRPMLFILLTVQETDLARVEVTSVGQRLWEAFLGGAGRGASPREEAKRQKPRTEVMLAVGAPGEAGDPPSLGSKSSMSKG